MSCIYSVFRLSHPSTLGTHMDPILSIVVFSSGLAIGFIAAKMLSSKQLPLIVANAKSDIETELATTMQQLEHTNEQFSEASNQLLELQSIREDFNKLQATHEEHKKSAEEKLDFLESTKKHLEDQFKLISNDVAKKSREEIKTLAESTVKQIKARSEEDLEKRTKAIDDLVSPVKEQLTKVNDKLVEYDKNRTEAFGRLDKELERVIKTSTDLKSETSQLVGALKRPQAQGDWGELHLKRVVELAGLTERCDFDTQHTIKTDEGKSQRPDMVVHLPGDKIVVVDAKSPSSNFTQAIEAETEIEKKDQLKKHAQSVRNHVKTLTQKAYFEQFINSPEFVIMFMPSDALYAAAVEQDPDIVADSIAGRVIIATPTTLIALLKSIAYGWQQETLAQNSQQIQNLGKELYARVATLTEHIVKMGNGLTNAVTYYNKAIGSLERRVLSSARKFDELGVATGKKDIAEVQTIEISPGVISAPELLEHHSNERADDEDEN